MEYRAELREIAVARNAVMFLAAILPLFHLVDDFNILCDNEVPITEALAEHFFSLPPEETLRRGRPAQHAEFVVPLDDCERRVFNVKGEAAVVVNRCCFGEFAFGNVANNRNATDHLAALVMTGRVITIKETVAAR